MYNCVINNFLGQPGLVISNHIRVNGDNHSSSPRWYIQDSGNGYGFEVASAASIARFIESIGYSDVNVTGWDITGEWNLIFEFENGQSIRHSLQNTGFSVSLDGLESRLIGYHYGIPEGVTITFQGRQGSSNSISTHQHIIEFNAEGVPSTRLTTIEDFRRLLRLSGIEPTPSVPDEQPSITCFSEDISSPSTTIVVLGDIVNPTDVVNRITERTAIESQILSLFYQSKKDLENGDLDIESINESLIELYQSLENPI